MAHAIPCLGQGPTPRPDNGFVHSHCTRAFAGEAVPMLLGLARVLGPRHEVERMVLIGGACVGVRIPNNVGLGCVPVRRRGSDVGES